MATTTSTSTYTLYGAPLSTSTLQIAIVLHEKQIPFRFVHINMGGGGSTTDDDGKPDPESPFNLVPYLVEETTVTTTPAPRPPRAPTPAPVPAEAPVAINEGGAAVPDPDAPADAEGNATPVPAQITDEQNNSTIEPAPGALDPEVNLPDPTDATATPAPNSNPEEAPATTEDEPQEPTVHTSRFTLSTPLAICRYLSLRHLNSTHSHQRVPIPNLLPPVFPGSNATVSAAGASDSIADALQKWSLFEQAYANSAANFEIPAQTIMHEKLFKPRLGLETDQAAYDQAYTQLSRTLDLYDKLLAHQPYLSGENLTLADLAHIPLASRLQLAGAGDLIDSRLSVSKWLTTLNERESWKALKKNGVESWVPTVRVNVS